MEKITTLLDFENQKSRDENSKIKFGRVSICLEILVDDDYLDKDFILNNKTSENFKNIDDRDNFFYDLNRNSLREDNFNKTVKEFLSDKGYCIYSHSYETDLFSYKYQSTPPYYTKCYSKTEFEIEFSQTANFISEGRKEQFIADSPKTVKMNGFANYTYFFNSKLRVWHLVLAPQDDCELTEIDIIKIMKLFSGIQESGKPSEKNNSEQELLKFKWNNGKSAGSLNEFFSFITDINYKFNDKYNINNISELLTSGIVAIDMNYNTYNDLGDSEKLKEGIEKTFDELCSIVKTKQGDLKADDDNLDYVFKALCGITLGIFDFDRMSIEEITDTLSPREKSIKSTSFLTINRGVLTSYAIGDDTFDSAINKHGISPYLIIPSAVLAHNDYVSRDAENRLNKIWNELNLNLKIPLNTLIFRRDDIDDLINDDILANVFQYPTEQELYTYGMVHRGIKERIEEVRVKLIQLDKIIELKQSRQSLTNEKWIQSILLVLSLLQIISVLADFNSFWESGDKQITNRYIYQIVLGLVIFGILIILFFILKNTKVDKIKHNNSGGLANSLKAFWKSIKPN